MIGSKLLRIGMLCNLRALLVILSFTSAALPVGADENRDAPKRANDLRYGEVLYEYFQGRSFESLSLINVAKQKGGIEGHGDHPLLIEGGLMLAYGMTRSAHQYFERILSDELKDTLSPEVRNQAWFYLGKVFYLEKDYSASRRALEKVDSKMLADSDLEIFFEWRYLLNQIQLKDHGTIELRDETIESRLADGDLWIVYTLYNLAVLESSRPQGNGEGERKVEGENEREKESENDILHIISGLNKARDALRKFSLIHGSSLERAALQDRIRLSLAQELIKAKQYQNAIEVLNQIPYESLVGDEALFYFAIAQSHLQEHALAIAALNRLKDKPLFTPWLKQVPYALAYLYEQLGDTALSVQAYKAAGDHYDAMILDLDTQQEGLSEASLLGAIEVPFAKAEYNTETGYIQSAMPVSLGVDSAQNDAYGRLQVRPAEFYIASLLATEAFQLHLRDLHELYKLQNALDTWRARVATFRVMLTTRELQRTQRLGTVSSTLDAQNASQWSSVYQRYKSAIHNALENEDLEFFMTQEQIDVASRLERARDTLSLLPEGEDKHEFSEKFSRIERFFNWQLADQYGVNRWAAQRQLKELSSAMKEFEMRRNFLQSELDNEGFQNDLEARVANAELRIEELSGGIEGALANAREELVALARAELDRQKEVVVQYRLSARHAQARLTDDLYRNGSDGKPELQRKPPASESSESPEQEPTNGEDK